MVEIYDTYLESHDYVMVYSETLNSLNLIVAYILVNNSNIYAWTHWFKPIIIY